VFAGVDRAFKAATEVLGRRSARVVHQGRMALGGDAGAHRIYVLLRLTLKLAGGAIRCPWLHDLFACSASSPSAMTFYLPAISAILAVIGVFPERSRPRVRPIRERGAHRAQAPDRAVIGDESINQTLSRTFDDEIGDLAGGARL